MAHPIAVRGGGSIGQHHHREVGPDAQRTTPGIGSHQETPRGTRSIGEAIVATWRVTTLNSVLGVGDPWQEQQPRQAAHRQADAQQNASHPILLHRLFPLCVYAALSDLIHQYSTILNPCQPLVDTPEVDC